MDANYRHHSQTDDEFVLFVLPSIGDSSQPSSSNKPIHTSKPDMRASAKGTSVWKLKFSKLWSTCCVRNSRTISVEEQVAIFLYALAKNASNETLQYEFQHSGQTSSRPFSAVLDAIT
jgi:hypothetical protein